jgi:hypothetical protein
MANSTDMKSKRRKNFHDTDIDASLAEVELPVIPLDIQKEDEDAIDRLLIDTGFHFDEKLPENIDDGSFPVGYDEFGDDFDLADISTDMPLSGTEINIAGDLKADHSFPLDLIHSIDFPSDEKENPFSATNDDDLDEFPLHGLQSDEQNLVDDEAPVFDDSSLIEELDEFSDFSEFSDFQQPGLNADVPVDLSFSTQEDTADPASFVEQTPALSSMTIDEDELIVGTAELEAIDLAIEHDEFGDDLDDPYNTLSNSDFVTQTDEKQQNTDEQITSSINNDLGIPASDFDITADFDNEMVDNFDQIDDFIDEPIAQVINSETIQTKSEIDGTITSRVAEKSSDNADLLIDAAGIAALLQFKVDQEAINKKHKNQIADFEKKAKKSAVITYVAVGFGVTALITAVVLGVMAYSAKAEIKKLTALTTAQDTNNSGLVVPQNKQTEVNSNVVFNHEADNTIEAPKEISETSPEMKLDHAAAKSIHEVENITNHAMLSTPENPAPSTSVELIKTPSARLNHEKSQTVEASHKTDTKLVNQPKENVEPVAKKTSLSESALKSADSKNTKTPIEPEKKHASERKKVAHQVRKTELVEKSKKSITSSNKNSVKKKQKIVTSAPDWSVNLIAYKQQWYASSKAAEFSQKGVPVEVLPVKINNVTWYRLRVGGFNNKEEAFLYAGRVKKALNLSSVWVGNK